MATVLEIRELLRRFDMPLATQKQKRELALGTSRPRTQQKTFVRESHADKRKEVIAGLGGGGWEIKDPAPDRKTESEVIVERKSRKRGRARNLEHNTKPDLGLVRRTTPERRILKQRRIDRVHRKRMLDIDEL
jgi:hypothetical protein